MPLSYCINLYEFMILSIYTKGDLVQQIILTYLPYPVAALMVSYLPRVCNLYKPKDYYLYKLCHINL